MIKKLITKNRSYRRFYEEENISLETLKDLVGLARLSPSAANLQPLKFFLSWEVEQNEAVFNTLQWAGYLKEWAGPVRGERPSAYIIILGDKNVAQFFGCDHGIAAQSILLGAVEKGLGGCIIGSINKDLLRADLGLPDRFEILLVLALGKPKEAVRIKPLGSEGDIRYWRDRNGIHYVPKRALNDLIVKKNS